MTDEAELLQRLRNREKNSIDEAIRIYTPYLSTVLYHMSCRLQSELGRYFWDLLHLTISLPFVYAIVARV